MNRYRIYTEDADERAIREIVSEHFAGYTIFRAAGVWRGVSERSLVIEIIAPPMNDRVLAICEAIKKHNHQENVLLTVEQDIGVKYI